MADFSQEDFEHAVAAGRELFASEPHARSARYDRATGIMTLELYNGCSFSFPPTQLQGMANATDAQLADFELSAAGYGLHWEALDADFTVPGLLAGIFGTARFMNGRREALKTTYDRLFPADHHDEAA